MSTEFINDQWRLPNEENKSKVSNYSMDFDGSQKITLNSPIQLTTNKSISVWCYVEPTVNQNTLLGGDAFPIYYFWLDNPNSKIYIRDNTAITQLSTGTLSEGWTHFCITGDGTTATLYVNGVSTSTGTDRELDIRAIGGYVTGSSYFFNGKADGVSIFDYALSSSQVTTLYGSSSTGIGNPMSLSPKPVAYYPLGDQDAFNGADYLVPNSSLKDYVFDFIPNDYIDLPSNSTTEPTTAFSLSLWAKWDVLSGAQGLISNGQNRGYMIWSSGTTLQFYVYRASTGSWTSATSSVTLTIDTWLNIAATWDGSDVINIYVNGNHTGTQTGVTTPLYSNNPVIGQYAGNYFNGKLTNLQIFNSALPATGSNSVETLYNNGSPLTSMTGFSSLVSWYKLDASDTYDSSTGNWTIEDHAGSNDGTSSGMTQANLVQSDLSFKTSISPYALDFDSASSDYIDTNYNANLIGNAPQSFSIWFKSKSTGVQYKTLMGQYQENILHGWGIEIGQPSNLDKITWYSRNSSQDRTSYGSALTQNQWYHLVVVINSTSLNNVNYSIYLDGTPLVENATSSYYDNTSVLNSFQINNRYANNAYYGGGNFVISNVSIWNTALTSAQVTEIYNEGVPSNLNNHSAYSNLVSWWQLGSNSSFNSSLNQWTCIDEKGTNTGESSQTFNEDAIVDGVGSYANGLSSGMGGDEVIGDAPYSTANSLSVNMDVEDRVTDTPS
jgi:hypothetical protein